MMTLWLQAAGSFWEAVGESSGQEIVCLLHDVYLRFCVHSTPSSDCVLVESIYIYIYMKFRKEFSLPSSGERIN